MAAGRAKAVEAAIRVLDESKVRTSPVPVEGIAQRLGIEVIYELYDGDTSGLLIHSPDGTKTIGVNTFHANSRQRFTIAHEIGHALLHLNKVPIGRPEVVIDKPREVLFRDKLSSAASDRREIEANAFAAELLMPAVMVDAAFRERLQKKPQDTAVDLIGVLAESFQVSSQAMGYRLVNLNLIDPA